MKYADIIIDISHEAIDRAFQYEVPDSLRAQVAIGMEVMIPFGNSNHLRHGYVIGLSEESKYPVEKMKMIESICDKSVGVESRLISLAAWMKEQYGGTMIQALQTVLPVKEKVKQIERKTICLIMEEEQAKEKLSLYEKKHYMARVRLVKELLEDKELAYELVRDKLHISASTIEGLVKDGVIEVKTNLEYRQVGAHVKYQGQSVTLNEEQRLAVDCMNHDYNEGVYNTYLLHGVTGSGKTEVYLETIANVLNKGRQVIVLIPEIALTYQTVKRFRRRFGDRVTILNSKMSKGEKYDQYLRMKNGEVDIVIGPRSALFAPFDRLGLIIIDEEHETTYKNNGFPGYHAREVAMELAKRNGASVILGSATPSVISYTKAKLGEYKLLTLKNRANTHVMPRVHLVDLRDEFKNGNRSIFSETLKRKMEETLKRGEQIMLFMNRRGYESFISCRSCGTTILCPHCDVSLTLHGKDELMCHYCGYTRRFSNSCPACGSHQIAGFHMGTEKLEEEVKRLFPHARTLRMDFDTVKNKGGHESILEKFEQQEADVLIGTQMIVKGHDFGRVTLMGIVLADMSLHDSDYLANEKTFDLLTQAAGRAGRGDLQGEVVIQTYQPEHYSIVTAMKQDYELFYEQEIAYRSLLRYPPVYHMMVILVSSKQETYADSLTQGIVSYIKREFANEKGLQVIGPSKAMLSKLSDTHRRVVYCKHVSYNTLVEIKDNMESVLEEKGLPKQTRIYFDFDPMNMY